MIRFIPWIFAMLLFAAAPVLADQQVMELLRLSVPADQRDVWMDGERNTWQPVSYTHLTLPTSHNV